MENTGSQTALDLQYIKLLRLCLLPMAGWPSLEEIRKKAFFNVNIIYVVIQVLVIIGEVIYLHDIFGEIEFLLVGDAYIVTFLTIVSMVRLSLPQFETYSNILRTFIMEFHLTYFKHRGESFKKVFTTVDKISHYFTYYMSGSGLLGLILFVLSPMYVNIKNGAFTTHRHDLTNLTLEFTVKYKFPGYDNKENFFLTTIINVYLSFLCCVSLISIDLLLFLMVFQILGHLEILAINMRSVPMPKKNHLRKKIPYKSICVYKAEMYDEEENLEIKQILQELIVHHNLIISFTERISNFFGPILGVNYFFHLVCCCLLLLECSRGDPDVIVQFGPLTTMVFLQLIQISCMFELLETKSTALIDCVYDLPWQYMNISNQRTVCIMLLRVQKPIQVTAFGLAEVGVKTMANILKTTFSYYTFLRTL